MYDMMGKPLVEGDEVVTYAYGLCRVIGEEPYPDKLCRSQNGFRVVVLLLEDQFKNIRGETTNRVSLDTEMDKVKRIRSWKELAREAIAIQSETRLEVILTSFLDVIQEVKKRFEYERIGGDLPLANHPINILFSERINALVFHDKMTKFNNAYRWAAAQSKETEE